MLRPANYPPGSPGRGWGVFNVGEQKVGVINMLGQSGYYRVHLSNPFSYLPEIVKKVREQTNHIIVNFHATTTAEKQTLFHLIDGKVSAVSRFRNQGYNGRLRSDAQGNCNVITDSGRTGSLHSIGGLEPELELRKFMTQVPERSLDAWDQLELQGVLIDLDDSGKAVSIESLRIPCLEVPNEAAG